MSTNANSLLIDASAVTSSQSSNVQSNAGNSGAHIAINATVVPSGASLTPSIIGISNGIEYTLLAGSAIASTGINVLKIRPGISAVANASASDSLPGEWRLDVAVTGGSVSFVAAANLLI